MVGLDGSELSFRALRLAAALADDMKDNVVVVHVKNKCDVAMLESKCCETLLGAGIQVKRQAFETFESSDGWMVADMLIYLANHIAKGSGILVLGASGKEGEDQGRAGHTHLGSVAEKCQEVCKVPVVIVKHTQTPITELGVRRGSRPSRSSQNGLLFVVCVDTSNLARNAFDLAVLFAHKHDSIHVVHILDTEKGLGRLGGNEDESAVSPLFPLHSVKSLSDREFRAHVVG